MSLPDPPALEHGSEPSRGPAGASATRRAIVVTGMHRSGTSAVAGCLQRLGVDFGPRLMPPTPDNPRGFYEHIDIVNLHDRLLLAAGSSWSDTDPRTPGWMANAETARFREDLRAILRRDFGSALLWGLKDPRLCRLLPWWEPLWAELGTRPLLVIVLRDPRKVAASLARREGFSPGKAYLLWLLHILDAERATRLAERVFADFGDFLTDWRQALTPVGALLGQPWPISPATESAEEQFVDRRRAQAGGVSMDGDPPLWVDEVDLALRRERWTGDKLFALLDRVAGQVEAAQVLYSGAQARDNDLARELATLQRQARWYEAEWQKAQRRVVEGREQLERGRQEVAHLKSRVLTLSRRISLLRASYSSNVRTGRGWLRRLRRRFLHF